MKPPSTLLLDPQSCSSELPDILSNHETQLKTGKSSDNLLSEEFNSAESGESDKTKSKIAPNKVNSLTKSATVGSMTAVSKVKRNFVIPPKEQRKGFGKEFIPAFKPPEPTPLLIIKRTPSKVNLPPEVGKPKVALKTNIEGAKKYFGEVNKTPPKPKPILKRAETLKNTPVQNKLVKQVSLPETQSENTPEKSFNFEPEDSDLNKVDSYIEDLLANKEELLKPIDPNKYKITFEPEDEEEKVSSSIEDLLKALETETKPETEDILEKPDEKIEDLLQWMDSLDHQTEDRKVYRSYSDVKYKNLERVLKVPKRADSVISKIPKDNITYFERHMAGKNVEEPPQEEKGFKLTRSKTDVNFNRGRSSVDLDAVTNVDIKKVLMKFEMRSSQDDVNNVKENIAPRLGKRKSFSSFKFKENNNAGEGLNKSVTAGDLSKGQSDEKENVGETLSDLLKDIENFVDNTMESLRTTSDKNHSKNVESQENLSAKVDMSQSKKCIENVSENFRFLEDTNNETLPLNKANFEEAKDATKELKSAENTASSIKENTTQSTPKTNMKNIEKPIEASCLSIKTDNTKNPTPNKLKTAEKRKGVSEYENLKYLPENFYENTNKNAPAAPTKYAASVSVTETCIFSQPAPPSKIPEPKVPASNNSRPKNNVEALYAKVNKNRPKNESPLAPQRSKRGATPKFTRPQRPERQKSVEGRNQEQKTLQPVAPQRKKSTTASPQPRRKNTPPKNVDVRKYQKMENPKEENTSSHDRNSKTTNNNNNKDCCIQ